MQLRQMDDGHVMTLQSVEGHMIRLSVRSGRVVLMLSSKSIEGSGSGQLSLDGARGTVIGPLLEDGVFEFIVSF